MLLILFASDAASSDMNEQETEYLYIISWERRFIIEESTNNRVVGKQQG